MPLADRFTDLLTAWSTFGGAVGSILAVVVAYLLLRREIRSRNEERRDAEAAQARLITANVRLDQRWTFSNKVRSVICDLTNHSTAPIREVELGVWRGQLGTAKDGAGRQYMEIKPGETKSLTFQLAEPKPLPPEAEREVLADFGTAVTFTDAIGIRWSRLGTGQPQRVVFRDSPTGIRGWLLKRRLKRMYPNMGQGKPSE